MNPTPTSTTTTSTTTTTGTGDVMYFECPGCAEQVRLQRPIGYDAGEFCRDCDYPLFWSEQAAELMARPATSAVTEDTLQRDVGRPASDEPVACPTCAAPNPHDGAYCTACGRAMEPEAGGFAELLWKIVAVAIALGAVAVIVWLLLALVL